MDGKRQAILHEIPRLRRYARVLVRDSDAADDLVQDCLERALARLDNWQDGDNPRRWLFTIMHHLFIDQTRRNRRRAEIMREAASREFEAVAQPNQIEALESQDVVEALHAIDPDRRAALVLVAVEGLSYAEAATVLDIPAGTLMSRIARGRKELRRLLDDTARRRAFKVVDP